MTVVIGAGTSGTFSIPKGYLHCDDPVLGADAIDYASTAPQGQKILNILAYAATLPTGATIFQAAPIKNVGTAQIAWPNTPKMLRWLGAAKEVATLTWSGDPGLGNHGFKFPTQFDHSCEEVTLISGTYGSPIPIGGMLTKANALGVSTRGTYRRVAARGWRAFASIVNDHFKFQECDGRGNVFGLDLADNPLGGLGDFLFEGSALINDQSCASIAIASTATIANGRFSGNGHCGTSPFGVYRYQALNAANGASGNPQLIGVAVQYTPVDGMQVNGRNIPDNTTIVAGTVTGVAGNWSFMLSNAPTGPVTSVELGRRGTVLEGVEFENWSFEYCGQSMFYDELAYLGPAIVGRGQVDAEGSWTDITFSMPAEFGTGGSADWDQAGCAVGSVAGNVLNSVAVTRFTPDRTMVAIAPNIPNVTGGGSLITDVAGGPGNWTLTLADVPTGPVATVTVGKPKELANIEVGDAIDIDWTKQGPSIQSDAPLQPYARGRSLKNFKGVATSVIGSGPVGHKSFQIRARNRGGAEVTDMQFGGRGGWKAGGTFVSAKMADEPFSYGDLLSADGTNGRVRKCQAGDMPVGFSMGDYAQFDIAFYAVYGGDYRIRASNKSTTLTINNNILVKPDPANAGGVVAAVRTDPLVCGRLNGGGLAPLTVGQVYAIQ